MTVRLIKPGAPPPDQENKQAPVEVPIIDTLRSWVREFRSTKAARTRLDLERISNAGATSGGFPANYFKGSEGSGSV